MPMSLIKALIMCIFCLVLGIASPARCFPGDLFSSGLLYDDFPLVLDPGHRTEALGPIFSFEQRDSREQWGISPLLSLTRDTQPDFMEFDFLYPLLTYDRFGAEHRLQFFQLLSFSGGQNQQGIARERFTLFPIYFQQRSSDPEANYTALFPVYGRLKHRLFRDEISFILFPLYSRTSKRDVVTDNYVYPIFHLRRGDELRGWQVWPLVGREHKEVTYRTNSFGETETVGAHDKFFALWPFFFNQRTDLGTENPKHQQALLPFYSILRSPQRDSSTWLWPLFTCTEDREKQYREWDAPWPLVVFARGEGKTTSRVWPFFSQAQSPTKQSDFYLWPVYKYNRLYAPPLDRERTRILFFLYSDLTEKNTDTDAALSRVDCWPLFTHRRDFSGNERLQILSLLEPLLPNNKSVERNYSPLWSLWRAEKNARTGDSSQSLLWNLYRREATPAGRKVSLLFGLFQYQSVAEGHRWRLFYVPLGKGQDSPPHESRAGAGDPR